MSDHAWCFYLGKAIQLIDKLRPKHDAMSVLKTDCWNEGFNVPVDFGLIGFLSAYFDEEGLIDYHCIDINEQLVNDCNEELELSGTIIHGDLLNMPYDNNKFDLILDFSTCDHIQDLDKLFSEYQRVLKKTGVLAIVSWFSRYKSFNKPLIDNSIQYYHNEKEFRDLLTKNKFNIGSGIDSDYRIIEEPECYLKYLFCPNQ